MIFCLLSGVLLSAIAHSTQAPESNSDRTVSQLIIAYSPKKDWNGAFHNYDESLTGLIAAAKARNLRVVLLNTDVYEGPNAKALIKGAMQRLIREQPSFVMVGTHGGQIKNDDGTTDTSLSFPGGIKFSDFQKSFDQENFAGVIVEACHSDNTVLSQLGQRAVSCASANSAKTARGYNFYGRALTAAIRMGKVNDMVSLMKGSILSLTEQVNADEKDLLGDSKDVANVPIYGPENYALTFQGKKFEIVNHDGEGVSPCYQESTNSAGDKLRKIASLPSKFVPEKIVAEAKAKISSRRLQDFFFNSLPQVKSRAWKVECSEDGKIVIDSSRKCRESQAIKIGPDCEQSFLRLLGKKNPRRNKDEVFMAPSFSETAKNYCVDLNKSADELRKDYVLKADNICADRSVYGCNFGRPPAAARKYPMGMGGGFEAISMDSSSDSDSSSGDFSDFQDMEVEQVVDYDSLQTGYHYGLGQCSPMGGICLPTASGAHLVDSERCSEIMNVRAKSRGVSDRCLGADKKEHAGSKGACFTPAINEMFNFIPWKDPYFTGADAPDVLNLAHSQVPSFKCVEEERRGQTSYSPKFDSECCEKNGGVVAQGIKVKFDTKANEEKDYSSTDELSHQKYLLALFKSVGPRCELKPKRRHTSQVEAYEDAEPVEAPTDFTKFPEETILHENGVDGRP